MKLIKDPKELEHCRYYWVRNIMHCLPPKPAMCWENEIGQKEMGINGEYACESDGSPTNFWKENRVFGPIPVPSAVDFGEVNSNE